MDLLAYVLALLAQPADAQASSAGPPVMQPNGGGIPITPGPHQQ
ncbi:hypothetical protein [Sphingomonas sp.]